MALIDTFRDPYGWGVTPGGFTDPFFGGGLTDYWGPGTWGVGLDQWGRPRRPARGAQAKSHFHPRTDMYIEGNNLHVEIELPGIPKENIDLSVTEDQLTVSTNKPMTEEERRGEFYLSERNFGNYFRRLRLPEKVNADNVQAKMENGVLHAILPMQRAREGGAEGRKRVGIESQ
jgi:HSP20 family molecular chaperone IbpA